MAALDETSLAIKRFVHVSSLTSYGPSTSDKAISEQDDPRPVEYYGMSKREAESAIEKSGLPFTILRPGGIYGPRDVDYFELFKSIHRGMNVFFGNRERWQSCVYIDDCVDAIVASAMSEKAIDQGYMISDGAPLTWGTFQAHIITAAQRYAQDQGKQKRVRTLNLPEFLVTVAALGGELMSRIDKKPRLFNRQKAKMSAQEAWTCSIDKARADFGFAPKVGVAKGTYLAYRWYAENGWF